MATLPAAFLGCVFSMYTCGGALSRCCTPKHPRSARRRLPAGTGQVCPGRQADDDHPPHAATAKSGIARPADLRAAAPSLTVNIRIITCGRPATPNIGAITVEVRFQPLWRRGGRHRGQGNDLPGHGLGKALALAARPPRRAVHRRRGPSPRPTRKLLRRRQPRPSRLHPLGPRSGLTVQHAPRACRRARIADSTCITDALPRAGGDAQIALIWHHSRSSPGRGEPRPDRPGLAHRQPGSGQLGDRMLEFSRAGRGDDRVLLAQHSRD